VHRRAVRRGYNRRRVGTASCVLTALAPPRRRRLRRSFRLERRALTTNDRDSRLLTTTVGGGGVPGRRELAAATGATCAPERGQTADVDASTQEPRAAAPSPMTRLRRHGRISCSDGDAVIEIKIGLPVACGVTAGTAVWSRRPRLRACTLAVRARSCAHEGASSWRGRRADRWSRSRFRRSRGVLVEISLDDILCSQRRRLRS